MAHPNQTKSTPFVVVKLHLENEILPHKNTSLKGMLVSQGYPHGALSDQDLQALLASPHQSHVKIAIYTDIARVQAERAFAELQQHLFNMQQLQLELERRIEEEIASKKSKLDPSNPDDQVKLNELLQQEQALRKQLAALLKQREAIEAALLLLQKELVHIHQQLSELQTSYVERRAAVIEKYRVVFDKLAADHAKEKKVIRARFVKAVAKKAKIDKTAEAKLLEGFVPEEVIKEYEKAAGAKKVAFKVVIEEKRRNKRHDKATRKRLAKMTDGEMVKEFPEAIAALSTVVYHTVEQQAASEEDLSSEHLHKQTCRDYYDIFDQFMAETSRLDKTHQEKTIQYETLRQSEEGALNKEFFDDESKLGREIGKIQGDINQLLKENKALEEKIQKLQKAKNLQQQGGLAAKVPGVDQALVDDILNRYAGLKR